MDGAAKQCRKNATIARKSGKVRTEEAADEPEKLLESAAPVVEGSDRSPRSLARPRGAAACRPFVRTQLALELPELCAALAQKAKKGDVSAMKLLWQMAELDKQSGAVPERADVTKFVRETLAEHRRR